jgi:autotransporter-associated beta strand protein
MVWLTSWLGNTKTQKHKKKSSKSFLQLMQFEDRMTPAMLTWTGGGGDSNWTTAANWGGSNVVAGDDLVFADVGGPVTSVNDFAPGTTFNSITIESSNYTILGNDIDLTGDVTTTYTTSAAEISLSMSLGGGDIIVASGGSLTVGGSISGNAGLTISGGGTVLLAGNSANTYAGTTQVTDGTLVLAKTAGNAITGNLIIGDGIGTDIVELYSSEQIADSVAVTVNEGATFDLFGNAETIDTLTLQAGTVSIGTAGTLTVATSITSNATTSNVSSNIQGGTLDLNGNATSSIIVADDPSVMEDLAISSSITNGGISKSGSGILSLSGSNTYDGSTAVTDGAIQVESDSALGSTVGGTTVSSGASVFFDGSNLSVAESFTISGSGSASSGALASLGGSATITGTVDLAANSQIGAATSSELTIDGVIDDGASTYNITVLQAGTGRTTLGGNNTFDGNISVTAGYLRATHANALGDSTTSSTISFANTASLELAGNITLPANKSLTFSLNGVNNTDPKLINVSGNNTIDGTITLAGNEQFDVASGTTLTISSGIIQTGGSRFLVTSGAGTLILSGTSSYSGGTFITGGSLLVNGDISASDTVDVFGTGTIGGSGTLPDVSVNSGGTLAPGNSPGMISTGNLSMGSGATYSVELNGTTVGTQYDQTDVTGTVDLTNATLSMSLGFTPAFGDTFTIISNDGTDAITGTFNGLAEGATFTVSGTTFQISYVGGSNGNDVVLTALEAPTVSVTADNNPTVYGQGVVYSVTVSGSGVTPTGNVSLIIDGATVETLALSSGTATFTSITALSVGSHTVSVSYEGAGLYATSTGILSGSQTVNQASTTTSVSPTPNPSVYGQSVTLTANVAATSPGAGTATGTVSFFDGATLLGSASLSGGVATLSTSLLSIGSHSIMAVYAGDSNFVASSSSPSSQVISQASTISVVVSSDLSSAFGESVTLTATISAVAPGSGTATGTVSYFDGATLLGTATLSSGVATLTTSSFSVGTHSITAVYSGDSNFSGSTSSTISQVIASSASTTALITSDNSTDLGEFITLTATVTVVSPGTGTPTGDVEFFAGSTSLGIGTLSSGVASLITTDLAAGSYDLTAVYLGTAEYASSSSSMVPQTVATAATSLTIIASTSSTTVGNAITFTATLTDGSPFFMPPQGSIIFRDQSGTILGEAMMIDGVATLQVSSLTVGTYSIIAAYSGDSNYLGAVSSGVDITINAVPVQNDPVPVSNNQATPNPVPGDFNGDQRGDIVVGSNDGSSLVRVISSDGTVVSNFFAFDGFVGGVTNANGDINNDGFNDVITGTASMSSHVKVFDGQTGNTLQSFFAFNGYMGGVEVASGDIDGDGVDDIVVSTRGSSSHIKVFSGVDGSLIRSFFAFDGFNAGVNLAVGDVDGDGLDDIIVGSRGGISHVKVFNGIDNSELRSYFAFPEYSGNVTVSAGDLDGDGHVDVIMTPEEGFAHVKAYSGKDNSEIRNFFALPGTLTNISTRAIDTDGDGDLEIVTTGGSGGQSLLSIDGVIPSGNELEAYQSLLQGVYVG